MQKFTTYSQIKEFVAKDFEKMNKKIFATIEDAIKQNNEFYFDTQSYLNGSSKQIRSCLIFLFARLIDNKINKNIINLAAAVEIIHNATLIHDDIIDDADFRRGNTTIHKKYGNKLSIIAGDFLLSIAIKLLSEIQSPTVIQNFADCLLSLCKGETEQYFAENKTTTIKKYIEKSKAKTAALFIAALKSLANIKDPKQEKNLCSFAAHFGTAFQIKDDINNFINEKEQKPILIDIKAKNFTAPVIFAFGENKDLSTLTTSEIYKKIKLTNAIEKTEELIFKEITLAQKAIPKTQNETYYQVILDLCKLFLN